MNKVLTILAIVLLPLGTAEAQTEWKQCRLPANIVGTWAQDETNFVAISEGTVEYVSETKSFNFTITGVYRNSGKIMIVGMGMQHHSWGDEPAQLTLMVKAGYGANVIEVGSNESFTTSSVYSKQTDNQVSLVGELGLSASR